MSADPPHLPSEALLCHGQVRPSCNHLLISPGASLENELLKEGTRSFICISKEDAGALVNGP